MSTKYSKKYKTRACVPWRAVPLQVLHFDVSLSIDTIALGNWRPHTSDVYLLFEEEAVVAENLSALQLFVSLELYKQI